MTEDLEARIEARRRQAREREITEKAIAVVKEFGKEKYSDHRIYTDDKIFITISGHCEHEDCDKIEHDKCQFEYNKNNPSNPIHDYETNMGSYYVRFTIIQKKINFLLVKICVDESGVYELHRYSDRKKDMEFYRKQGYADPAEVVHTEEYDGISGISAYKPGDWEAHLDELYKRIPEHRDERMRRENEAVIKLNVEKVQREREQIETRKRCFGL